MKFAPSLVIGLALLVLAGCSTAANRRSVYAPYQQPTLWDNVFTDWESHKRPNQRFPDPFNDLPQLEVEPTPPPVED